MTNKNITTAIILSIVYCTSVLAQVPSKHEFSVIAGAGLSSLHYKTAVGNQKDGFGGLFGLGYSYSFTDKISLNTGVELALYSAQTTFDKLTTSFATQDAEGTSFEYRSSLTQGKETQNATMLHIPLMLQYAAGKKDKLYAAAGVKIGIPVSGTYKSTAESQRNTGYYPHEGIEYGEGFEFLGFGTYANPSTEADLNLKIAYILALETGMKWKLAGGMALYTGIYCDYGLNDIAKDRGIKEILDHKPAEPSNLNTNSLLASRNTQGEAFADKAKPIAVGIKLRLVVDLGI